MFCAQCSEKILSEPVIQGNDNFCCTECAVLATGFDPAEENGYYEEDDMVEDFFEDLND